MLIKSLLLGLGVGLAIAVPIYLNRGEVQGFGLAMSLFVAVGTAAVDYYRRVQRSKRQSAR